MQKVLIHYGEIALKGRNRACFEDRLIENIKKSALYHKVNLEKVKKERLRIVAYFEAAPEEIIKSLKPVFGIVYFSLIEEIEKTMEALSEKAKKVMEDNKKEGFIKIAFVTKRPNKNFPLCYPAAYSGIVYF